MLFLQLLQVLLFLHNLVLNVRCANIIVSRESPSEILTWTHGHKKCMISLSSVGKYSVNHRDSNHCHDASYYKQIKSYFLSHPSNNDTYKSRLFDAIVNLYDDLRLAHLPVNVSVPPYGGGRYALVHPISFSFPDSAILNSVPAKDQSLGSVIPGKKSTYIWDEQKYYDDLQKSLFVLTVKKAGWDCFRHNEILSSGSLPLFIDISGCPSAALGLHPKKLYSLLLSFPGLLRGPLLKAPSDYLESPQQLSVDWGQFDEAMYRLTAQALLQYTRNVLSCERVASYLLDVVAASSSKRAARNSSSTVPFEPMQQLRGSGVDSSNFNYTSSYTGRRARRDSSPFPHSILFLTHRSLGPGDYMVELLLLGLKNIMDPAHVLDFPRRNCIYRDTGQFNRSAYLEGKQHLYGGGFTFGYRLEDVLTDSDRAEAAVLQRLKRKEFDLIVVPSAHIDMLGRSFGCFGSGVCMYGVGGPFPEFSYVHSFAVTFLVCSTQFQPAFLGHHLRAVRPVGSRGGRWRGRSHEHGHALQVLRVCTACLQQRRVCAVLGVSAYARRRATERNEGQRNLSNGSRSSKTLRFSAGLHR